MAAAAILKIAFLAITRPIVRFQLNFVWGSRTACRQELDIKNCKFLKLKMADGFWKSLNRHISVKIVRFWWNVVNYIRYWTRLINLVTWLCDQELKLLKFKMAAAAILKIAFWAITYRPIVLFRPNFVCRSKTACRQGPHDKNCKFLKSKTANGRHFENCYIAISQWKIVRF